MLQRGCGNFYSNLVVIGKKPLRNYIYAVLERLSRSGKAVVAAKGNLIGKACTVVEFIRQRYPQVRVERIFLDSENYGNRVVPRLRIILLRS
ncbi:MAG: hypothetical protein ACTSXW_03880 [Candidatus Baldrarchaeia archaeon]